MATLCAIKVQSNDPSPLWVSGVVVQIYAANTTTLVTSGVTDVNGQAAFLLPDASYDVRFYKQGVSILPKQPQRIVVDFGSLVGNTFIATGHVTALPESIDPVLCRISGYVRGPDGSFLKGMKLAFLPASDLNVIGGNVVHPQLPMHISSDEDGYFDFTLLRGLQYAGYITQVDKLIDVQPLELDIRVPDLPALPLDALLFPLPVSAVFSVPTITLPVGGLPDSSVLLTVTYSDGSQRTTPPPWTGLKINNTDDTIVTPTILGNAINLLPLKAGVNTITLSRTITSKAVWNPAPDFSSGSLVVTVA